MGQLSNILLAIPSTGQTVKSATAVTLAGIAKTLTQRGVNVDFHNIDAAEVVTARDMFANMVLHSDGWDALLFVDSDMRFDAELVVRILVLGEDVVGTAYTRRQLDLDALVAAVKAGETTERAVARASDFVFKPSWRDGPVQLDMRDGFVPGAGFGMGCALIAKRALVAMIDAKVVRPRLDLHAGNGGTCWSFFEPLEHEGTRLGEDYSFCHRWTEQMGRKLWVCVDQALGHVGGYEYSARYLDTL